MNEFISRDTGRAGFWDDGPFYERQAGIPLPGVEAVRDPIAPELPSVYEVYEQMYAEISDQAGRQFDDTRVHGPAVLFHQHELALRGGGDQHDHRVGVGACDEFPAFPFDHAEVTSPVAGDVVLH